MSKEYILVDEYKRVVPQTQPYARLEHTKSAEREWWKDYHKNNPTLIMRIVRRLKKLNLHTAR